MLLLDVGNTRVKWATSNGGLSQPQAAVHDGDPVGWFARQDWGQPARVWLACVPSLREMPRWQAVVRERCGCEPHIVISQAEWNGLTSAYAAPEKLGVDRWLAMLALWNECRGPFCVAAAGTALTFDRVDAQGRHQGGLIAPGLGWSQRSLMKVTVTAGDSDYRYHDGLGQHSEEAIRQGSFFAARGVIEQGLRAPGVAAGEQRFITGGDAEILLPHLRSDWMLRPHLVLEGLLALARSSP